MVQRLPVCFYLTSKKSFWVWFHSVYVELTYVCMGNKRHSYHYDVFTSVNVSPRMGYFWSITVVYGWYHVLLSPSPTQQPFPPTSMLFSYLRGKCWTRMNGKRKTALQFNRAKFASEEIGNCWKPSNWSAPMQPRVRYNDYPWLKCQSRVWKSSYCKVK